MIKRVKRWFFQIENEVMIPFLIVGIVEEEAVDATDMEDEAEMIVAVVAVAVKKDLDLKEEML